MSWKAEYLILIVISTLIDYFMGILMERQTNKHKRRVFLIVSLCANLGLLFFFKYFNFVADNFNQLFGAENASPMMSLLLPVGISFYTFQTLSYSIDVYHGRQKAESHLGYFALYVSFFPQLVAGPIERFSRLTPQLKAFHAFSYNNLVNGLRLILFGLFVKMVLADNLAVVVDAVYQNPESFSKFDLLTGILFYSFQIYGDFYGYSMIAIGSAQILGIQLMDNFKTPYFSRNIAEFWQRWHISLSTWFRDYVYLPLGGNRVKQVKWVSNILIVFVVSGIWHGANWTFVIWGALFGLLYLVENGFNKLFGWNHNTEFSIALSLLLRLKTFLIVTFIWVFFRSQSFGEAMQIFTFLIHGGQEISDTLTIPNFVWVVLIFFITIDIMLFNKRFDKAVEQLPVIARWLIYAVLVFGVIALASVDELPFIYFQF